MIAGFALSSILNCQKSNIKKDKIQTKIIEQLKIVMSGNLDRENAQENFQLLIDSLNNEVLPSVSGKDKDETTEVIQYFEGIKANAPDYLDNEDNLIEAGRMFMRMLELFARIDPNDFDTNLIAATGYLHLATSIGGYESSTEKAKIFNQEFKKKSIQAAKALVVKFPNNPMSYGQLAHTTFYTGGDEKEVVRQLNECLKVDKNFEYCKDFLEMMKNG